MGERDLSGRIVRVLAVGAAVLVLSRTSPASAGNLTLAAGGKVTFELVSSDAVFSNTLAVVPPAGFPNTAVSVRGCDVLTTTIPSPSAVPPIALMSEKAARRGCRVELDSDPNAPGVQGFPAGTTFEILLCANTDGHNPCGQVWSTDVAHNADHFDHVHVNAIAGAAQAWTLSWEDLANGGDNDFNDLIANARVDGDTDGDGLWDDWETNGIDSDGINGPDFTLPGANVNRRDVYVWMDYMDCGAGGDCPGTGHSDRPTDAAKNDVQNFFNNSGRNITLHLEFGNAVPHQRLVDLGCGTGSGATFDAVKGAFASNPRRFAYHYMLFGHLQPDFHGDPTSKTGCAEEGSNDALVTLGEWNDRCVSPGPDRTRQSAPQGDDIVIEKAIYAGPNRICDSTKAGDDVQEVAQGSQPRGAGGTDFEQAGTMMHELGHNLALHHGGNNDGCDLRENEARCDFKPNRFSVMNHAFEFGIPAFPVTGAVRLDYSDGSAPDLDENAALIEMNGAGGRSTDSTSYFCSRGLVFAQANGPIDWDCSGGPPSTVPIRADVNNDLAFTPLKSFDDWSALHFAFQATLDYEEGVHSDLPAENYTYDTRVEHNLPPVAAACALQPVECTGAATPVQVDGRCSFDPEGPSPLAYAWTSSTCALATSSDPVLSATCPRGGQVSLVVTDPQQASSAPLAVTAPIVDTTAPVVQPTPPASRAFSVCDDAAVALTLTVPSVSDVCGKTTLTGQIVGAGGVSLASPTPIDTATGQVMLRPGTFLIQWRAVDEAGNATVLEETVVVNATASLALCCPRPADQTLIGTDAADVLARLQSTASLNVDGRGGSDQISTGSGNDCMLGGPGSDSVSSASGDDVAYGGPGDDVLTGCLFARGGTFKAHGNDGSDNLSAQSCTAATLLGGAGADNITGSPGNDTLIPGSGVDGVSALAGNDTVVLYDDCEAAAGKVLDGGPGNDTLISPLSLRDLKARGVVVTGFEQVVVRTDQRFLADCFPH